MKLSLAYYKSILLCYYVTFVPNKLVHTRTIDKEFKFPSKATTCHCLQLDFPGQLASLVKSTLGPINQST